VTADEQVNGCARRVGDVVIVGRFLFEYSSGAELVEDWEPKKRSGIRDHSAFMTMRSGIALRPSSERNASMLSSTLNPAVRRARSVALLALAGLALIVFAAPGSASAYDRSGTTSATFTTFASSGDHWPLKGS
jgi:hypothetical protein